MAAGQFFAISTSTKSNVDTYKTTTESDSGVIHSYLNTNKIVENLINQGLTSSIKLLWTGEMGTKIRTSGVYSYASKLYSDDSTPNNLTQTTEASQPYISGNIAINENMCLQNPNTSNSGNNRFLTHSTISFTASQPWTVSACFNWNGEGYAQQGIGFGGGAFSGPLYYALSLMIGGDYRFGFYAGNNWNIFNENSYKYVGKNTIVHFVADGVGNLSLYINGVFKQTLAITPSTAVSFSEFLRTFGFTNRTFTGRFNSYAIYSMAYNQAQVTAEYSTLRNIYPEIDSVTIGTQTWQTHNYDVSLTPNGWQIPEIQEDNNTEKLTNGTFTDATGWTLGSGHTISGGLFNINTAGSISSTIPASFVFGRYYKVIFTISNYVSGTVVFNLGGYSQTTSISADGTYTQYIRTSNVLTNTTFYLTSTSGSNLSVDNVSILAIGWLGLSELYDSVYASTAGSTTVKEKAANKAAAGWCYYSNSTDLGNVYSKLYNWYAWKLIQDDITDHGSYGWHLPSVTELTTLQTYLGGSTVAGGHLKLTGTTYWSTPNTGADNSTKFSLLPGGYRDSTTAAFGSLAGGSWFWGSEQTSVNSHFVSVIYNSANMNLFTCPKSFGFAIRLIKN